MSQEKGYVQDRERILNSMGAYLVNEDGWTGLKELRGFMEDLGYSSHATWTALNAYSAAGLVQSVDRAERTEIRLVEDDWDLDDFPEYVTVSEEGEAWAELQARSEWRDIGETRVPSLDAALFEDFLERHGYDDRDVLRVSSGGETVVASYDRTSPGDKEYWRVVVNDEEEEEDRLAVMVRFNEEDTVFQPRNRRNYAEKVWTPLLVLQQRNAWANQASRETAGELEALRDSWEEMTGKDFTLEEAYLKELESLSKEEGGYEEVRDATVERYYGNEDLRPSRILLPYSEEVESRIEEAALREGALAAGSEHGRDRGPEVLRRHLDSVYEESKARS